MIDTNEAKVSGVSWAAIAAGAVASAALTLVLLALGMGLGFTVASPFSSTGASATSFKIWTGLYFIVVAMISSAIGGYLAGRLRTKWTGLHTHEVYFRDTAHGFLAWAFATVISASVLAGAAAHIVGGAASGAVPAAGQIASNGVLDSSVDTLLRADPSKTPADTTAARAEITRLLTRGLANGGDINPQDRAYLAQVVAARSGIPPADAEKRVSDVIAQAKVSLEQARKAAARLSIWLTASLLIGAFSASLAATEGGQLRDAADVPSTHPV